MLTSLLIPVVLLTLTILNDEGRAGHMVVQIPEGSKHCEYTKDIMIADERATQAAEAKMNKADVQPRMRLMLASCSTMRIDLRGDKT